MQFERVHDRQCTQCIEEDTCAWDKRNGELICIGCGLVLDDRYDWPENSYKSRSFAQFQRAQRRTYIPYKRRYHFNERLAQRNAVDPRVPRRILHELSAFYGAKGTDTAKLDSHDLCTELRRRGYKQFCERWVQIKYRLTTEDLSELEDHEEDALLHIKPADRQYTDFPDFWPHRWLDDDAIFAFRFYFTKVSEAFDNMFFKAGKRHTSKCYAFNNTTAKHARHNLVSRKLMSILCRKGFLSLVFSGKKRSDAERHRTQMC